MLSFQEITHIVPRDKNNVHTSTLNTTLRFLEPVKVSEQSAEGMQL